MQWKRQQELRLNALEHHRSSILMPLVAVKNLWYLQCYENFSFFLRSHGTLENLRTKWKQLSLTGALPSVTQSAS